MAPRKKRAASAEGVPDDTSSAPDVPHTQASPASKKIKPLIHTTSIDIAAVQPKALRILTTLQSLYPKPAIPLNHSSNFQLLAAVMLSAQSTDAKVNTVTPALFELCPTPAAMAQTQVADIERIIKVLGLAPTKARNLAAMSQMLVEQHGGEVPGSFAALEALPGVGHKTASVVMAQAFGHEAFPVDTHIHRLAQRWGLTVGSKVEQSEADLKALLPPSSWHDAHLQMIYFGREHCPAMAHDPAACPICSWAAVPPYDKAGFSPPRPGKPGAGPIARGKSRHLMFPVELPPVLSAQPVPLQGSRAAPLQQPDNGSGGGTAMGASAAAKPGARGSNGRSGSRLRDTADGLAAEPVLGAALAAPGGSERSRRSVSRRQGAQTQLAPKAVGQEAGGAEDTEPQSARKPQRSRRSTAAALISRTLVEQQGSEKAGGEGVDGTSDVAATQPGTRAQAVFAQFAMPSTRARQARPSKPDPPIVQRPAGS